MLLPDLFKRLTHKFTHNICKRKKNDEREEEKKERDRGDWKAIGKIYYVKIFKNYIKNKGMEEI